MTPCYKVQRPVSRLPQLLKDGVEYVAATAVARSVGVTRQTLWRWRTDGKVPTGHRFRTGEIFFTRAEADRVREYATLIEPATPRDAGPISPAPEGPRNREGEA